MNKIINKKLMNAIYDNDLARVKNLIQNGANPNAVFYDGWTILMTAVAKE